MFNGEFTIRVRGKKMLVAEVGSTEDVLRVRRAAHEAQISDVRLFTNESAVRQHLLCEGAQEISLAWCHLHQVPGPRDNACDVRDLVPEDYIAWKDCFLWFQSHQYDMLGFDPPPFGEETLRSLFEDVLVDGLAVCAVGKEDDLLGISHVALRPSASFLSEFWVMPGVHRSGVGQAMLRAVFLALEAEGHERLKFNCITRNLEAMSFYQAMGATVLPHDCFQLSG